LISATANNKEVLFLKGRVNLLSTMLQLGHDAYTKETEEDLSFHILNNSRQIMPYSRSCLVEFSSGKPHIVGVMGQAIVNQSSDYVLQMKRVLQYFGDIKEQVILSYDLINQKGGKEGAISALNELTEDQRRIMLLPLLPPDGASADRIFVWVVEFTVHEELASNSLSVLASHYAEALWYKLKGKTWSGSSLFFKIKKLIRPLRMLLILTAASIWACLYYKVPISSKADFELVPEHYGVSYAPIDGVIEEVSFRSGSSVSKGSTILKYNDKALNFELSLAEKRLKEISVERSIAEVDPTRRAEVKILGLQMQQEMVKIDEIKWKLSQTEVTADYAGILVMEEKEVLLGKEVRAGERLFETVFSEQLLAEIYLNEKDAAVLEGKTGAELFLHARPEESLPNVEIISISPKPFITETNEYCYRVRVKFDDKDELGLVGMRGVARLTGETVTLGYYLFRNMILAWREL